MREILFRGKRIDNHLWVEGYYLCLHGEEPLHIIVDAEGQYHRVDPDTVGQLTGLTDKNGRKIFEGDVCRVCLDPEICVGKVIWDDKIASYNVIFDDGNCVLPLDIGIAKNKVGDKVWIEVIGNIHDDPELLGCSHEPVGV